MFYKKLAIAIMSVTSMANAFDLTGFAETQLKALQSIAGDLCDLKFSKAGKSLVSTAHNEPMLYIGAWVLATNPIDVFFKNKIESWENLAKAAHLENLSLSQRKKYLRRPNGFFDTLFGPPRDIAIMCAKYPTKALLAAYIVNAWYKKVVC